MSFSTLRTQIQSKLESITNIQQVKNYPTVPTEFPGATITPSDTDSDYETTEENKRIYTFVVRLFYPAKEPTMSTAISALEGLIDEVVDEFDKDETMTGISMPAKYTLIQLMPTPSVWDYSNIPDGYLTADIGIKAIVSFDTT